MKSGRQEHREEDTAVLYEETLEATKSRLPVGDFLSLVILIYLLYKTEVLFYRM